MLTTAQGAILLLCGVTLGAAATAAVLMRRNERTLSALHGELRDIVAMARGNVEARQAEKPMSSGQHAEGFDLRWSNIRDTGIRVNGVCYTDKIRPTTFIGDAPGCVNVNGTWYESMSDAMAHIRQARTVEPDARSVAHPERGA